jgi:hypothetical protein
MRRPAAPSSPTLGEATQLLPAREGDRTENLNRAIQAPREAAAKERAFLSDEKNVAELRAGRAKADTDAKYCWK